MSRERRDEEKRPSIPEPAPPKEDAFAILLELLVNGMIWKRPL